MHRERQKDDIRFAVRAVTWKGEEIVLVSYGKHAFEAENWIRKAYKGIKRIHRSKTMPYNEYQREQHGTPDSLRSYSPAGQSKRVSRGSGAMWYD